MGVYITWQAVEGWSPVTGLALAEWGTFCSDVQDRV